MDISNKHYICIYQKKKEEFTWYLLAVRSEKTCFVSSARKRPSLNQTATDKMLIKGTKTALKET